MNGRQWSPVTKSVWYLFLIGIPLAIWGWQKVLIFVIAWLVVFGAIAAVHAAVKRNSAARPDEDLDRIVSGWKD